MKELIAKAKSLLDEIDAGRKAGMDEATLKAKSEECAKIETQIIEGKAVAARRKALAEAEKEESIPVEGKTVVPAAPRDHRAEDREHSELFLDYVSGKSLSDRAMDALAPNTKARDVEKSAVRVPAHIAAAVFGAQFGRVFGKTMVSNSAGDAGVPAQSSASAAYRLVPPDYRAQLIQSPVAVSNVFDKCRIIPAVNGTAELPVLNQSASAEFAGVSVSDGTEGTEPSEVKSLFTNFTVTTSELSAMMYPTARLLRRSSINLEALLTDLLTQAFKHVVSYRILNGGTGFTGIVGASGVNNCVRTSAGTVAVADFTTLEYAVRKPFRSGAQYVMVDAAERVCKGLVDSYGQPLLRRFFSDGIDTTINGYTYDTNHDESVALGSEGDVVFGNFQNYIVGIEQDLSIAMSDHYKFGQGLVAMRAIAYVGGKPAIARAFSTLDNLAVTTTAAATTTAGT